MQLQCKVKRSWSKGQVKSVAFQQQISWVLPKPSTWRNEVFKYQLDILWNILVWPLSLDDWYYILWISLWIMDVKSISCHWFQQETGDLFCSVLDSVNFPVMGLIGLSHSIFPQVLHCLFYKLLCVSILNKLGSQCSTLHLSLLGAAAMFDEDLAQQTLNRPSGWQPDTLKTLHEFFQSEVLSILFNDQDSLLSISREKQEVTGRRMVRQKKKSHGFSSLVKSHFYTHRDHSLISLLISLNHKKKISWTVTLCITD